MCEDMVDGSEWERRQCESECDDLVVVRHHGSVSGNRHSLRAVSG